MKASSRLECDEPAALEGTPMMLVRP